MDSHQIPCRALHTSEIRCTLEMHHAGPHEGPLLMTNLEVPDGTIVTWDLSYGYLHTKDDKSFVAWEMCDSCKVRFYEDGHCGCSPDSEQSPDSWTS